MDLEYLQSFLPSLKQVKKITEVEDQLPLSWKEILLHDSLNRKEELLKTWERYFKTELSNTLELFNETLKAIDLIQTDYGLSLLYTFEIDGELKYREGRYPNSINNIGSNQLLKNIPVNILSFYSEVHSGWYEIGSEAMGFLPVEQIKTLEDTEFNITENYGIEIEKTITLFSNGSGGYLCMDLSKLIPSGIIWWHDDKPTLNINFWDVFDEWTIIGLTD